ncbi:peptide MFS transporter [Flavobacterium johnsoniae]|jgi:POT family proton-dependent oligopeptide transporter|uniref:Proton-dependent oligopeptide transporter, POT family n=2 Tax=Flavobacterium johnsoniae TaxID=986 RepID=A0A1M6QRT1_FLAJO|nr:peptide MFS transporter [Flavobacterium johnsoniae]ABQ04452.1 amino acid/peptide transporter [Flavobacterium johnsoniae UW101]OXE97778.1 MFS transporter [Flavobacterium johnsoniae UW101]WQG83752.1 peptide MFS transporter [Flavobacterium johnsoniae UW101]SHG06004.1 proton-dependent oligopeptide transporter, POT family [Flavobacterium johnsoniae]SHK22813.1 proton-dependent oligopeptide transporter, POT family [Flavobacterium johnsoniae]
MGETQVKTAHPKGLWVLFGTEMWERFNFYGMRALLTLFLVNSLLMKEEEASLIYGGFLGLCYLTPMLGGFVADRYLGNRNCILLGGLLMAIGQMLLFTSGSVFESNLDLAKIIMYSALGVIVFGNGFFKPNISSMVGSLYPKQEKTKLDSAFTIFYMGINIGAFLGQSICPLLGDVKDAGGIRDIHAFRWGFMAASAAMLLGTILFYFLKNKYVVSPEGKPLGGLPSKNDASDFEEGESQKANFSNKALAMAGVAFIALGFFFHYVVGQNLIYTLIYSSGLALAGLIISDTSLTKVERDRIIVIYIVSFFIIFFWAAFEQAGSSLTFIADNQTDRHFFGWAMPPSMVQIFNGMFVVFLAVPFSVLWDTLRAKGKEPISPVKLAAGLVIISVSFFMIATQVSYIGTSGLLLVKWLILLYFLNTCAELCLSPIGLSLVGKLSPKRFASLLYGVFFLSNASGYALGGTLGSILPATGDKFAKAKELGIDLQAVLDKKITLTADQLSLLDHHQISAQNPIFAGFEIHNLYEFFMVFVVLTGIAAILLFALTPLLKKLMHGVR